MSQSFRMNGNTLPVTLKLDEREVRVDCPTCARTGGSGTINFAVAADRTAATTPAKCSAGHVVMVAWSRENADA